MMNSPKVIVAYLNSKVPYDIWGGSWSNKKWRCLFIVDDNFICKVKSYPYQNAEFEQKVIEWIAELAKENLGVEYDADIQKWNGRDAISYHDVDYKVFMRTGHMYNDFGDTNHFIALNPNKTDEYINDTYYNYSGESQCMWCGSLYVCEGDDENDRVLCDCCETYHRCAWCGDNVEDEYLYEMYDGAMLCEYCMENAASRCPISEQLNLSDNMLELHLYDSETETKYYNSILVLDEVWYNFENQWKEFSSMPQPVLMEYNDWRQEYFVDIHSLTEFGRDCYALDEEWTELEPMPKNSN
jgi:hypothetical protein